MAIIAVTELWDAMTVTETAADGHTATRKFQVISDIPDESPGVVLLDNRLPVIGSNFPGAITVRCTERTPSRIGESREVWEVTCSYKSILSQDERQRIESPNPLDRAATIEWSSQKVMKAFRRVKRSGYYQNYFALLESNFEVESACNSASDPFEPVLEYHCTEWIATIKKNVDRIPSWFLEYEDAVNDDDFVLNFYGQELTIPKGCAKLGAISMPKSKQENGTEFIQLSFQIVTRQKRPMRNGETEAPEPWDDEILDTGLRTYEIIADDGQPIWGWKNVEDTHTGGSITLPVPFNGEGKPIDRGADDRIEESELWWSLVAPYKRRDFSVLPIT